MSGNRYIDLAIRVCLADVERDASDRPRWKAGSDEQLVRVGGRWDRRRKRWSRTQRASQVLTLRFHRGQEAAARWFAEWLTRFARNDWRGVERVWSVLLIGGRRSGKTHVSCAVMVVFAVLNPRARLWAISPTLETGDELDNAFRELLPRRWYTRRQAKTGRATTYRLANGSVIQLRSGVKPERLKAGRVDLALLNEAQEIDEAAYLKLRPAIADRGGLVLLAANPPDRPSGRWVEEHYVRAKNGEADARVFVLDPRKNPFVNYEALLSIAKESDEKTFQRDVLGLFAPIGDTVFHAWEDEEHWIDPPSHLVDVTAEVTKRELGRAAADIVGMDFQRIPAMVGVAMRFFRDPTDPDRTELLWVVDEAVVEEADENDLIDALEGIPRWRHGDGAPQRRDRADTYRGWPEPGETEAAHAACVIDASGFYQDGAHTQGRTSDRYLKARRWAQLYKPQKDSDRNPAIVERMKAGNALLKAAGGRRRLFVARHCVRVAEAMRLYENKNGIPNRRSQYAHIVDAVTYVVYRFAGRPKVMGPRLEYRSVGPRFDRREFLGG